MNCENRIAQVKSLKSDAMDGVARNMWGLEVNRTIWIGVIGGGLLVAALLLNWLSNPEPTPEPPPPAEQGEATAPPPPSPPAPAPTTEESAPAEPEVTAEAEPEAPAPAEAPVEETAEPPASTETESQAEAEQEQVAAVEPVADEQPEALPEPVLPSFDVVRIDPNGDAVIAGRAEPGSTVTVLDDGSDLGIVPADGRGEWVYLPTEPLTPGPHELKLKSELADGTILHGTGTVVLVVPKPGQDIAGRETETAEPQTPLVVLIPDEAPGAEVIQAPPADQPEAEASTTEEAPAIPSATATAEPEGVQSDDGALSVETVDYDPSGNISIAGRGPKQAKVIAYLDNDPIGETPVDGDGKWRINPNREVAPGVYTMRLDAVRDDSVVARLEIPFSRAAPLTDLSGDAFIVVQPGNSLWRIARRTLGDGYSYTVIYEANSDQIRDPDLIYPGQVFEIPK